MTDKETRSYLLESYGVSPILKFCLLVDRAKLGGPSENGSTSPVLSEVEGLTTGRTGVPAMRPNTKFRQSVDLTGIEPVSRQCECRVLPLNHRPPWGNYGKISTG